MRKFLFVPILFLMLNLAAAEDFEVYEVKMVVKIINDVEAFLKTQIEVGIDDNPNHHQGIADHIGIQILETKYRIDPYWDDYSVFVLADPQTLKATFVYITFDLVFDNYTRKFPLTNNEGDTNE